MATLRCGPILTATYVWPREPECAQLSGWWRMVMVKNSRMLLTVVVIVLAGGSAAFGQNGTPLNPNSKNVLTLAVYGDSPYGSDLVSPPDTAQLEKTPAFIASINRDPK